MTDYPDYETARQRGERFYSTGKPCWKGHQPVRYVNNGGCVECARAKSAARYEANPDAVRQQSARWKADNPERAAQTVEDRRKRRPFAITLAGVRARCRRNGWDMNITEEYVAELYAANDTCPVFGTRMLHPLEEGPLRNRASIDRIDPSKGYVVGNVALMSYLANTIKQDVTDPAIFRRLAEWLEEQQSAEGSRK